MPGPGPLDGELPGKELIAQVPAPVVGSQADTTRKLKSALTGQDADLRFALCPSPPKKVSQLSTPPASVGLLKWNSADALPTPPIVGQSEINGTRRVRSGPKERNTPVNCEVTPRVRSGPTERHNHDTFTANEMKSSERTESGDKRKKKFCNDSCSQKTSREELSVYYEETVKPLLNEMEGKLAEKNATELCQDCLKLWNALDRKGMIGKANGSSSARRRGEILRTVFKFLDIHNPRLLLRLSRLVLSVSIMFC